MDGNLNLVKRRSAVRFNDWPAADQEAWDAAFVSGGLWAEGGRAAGWSDAHRDRVMWGYGRWLRFLADRGELGEGAPSSRVNRDRIDTYIAELKGTISPRAVSNYVKHLVDTLRIMGCDGDLQWLRETNALLRRQIRPARNKRSRLRDSKELLDLGISLMDEVTKLEEPPSVIQAAQYRDGLIIALLACRPLRRRTLVGIRIGKQLVQEDGHWWLVFIEEDMKMSRPFELEWPEPLVPYLETYLSRFRPRFKNASGHDYLWASKNGRPLGGVPLNKRVCEHTERAFGKSIPIHLFRDSVATTISLRDPEHVWIASQILGHSRLDTAHQHYIQAGAIEASRSHIAVIGDMRRRSAVAEEEIS